MTVIITKGAHWRNVHLPEGPSQFAHVFDESEPEDVAHQASNFITYAHALGNSDGPHVLIGPSASGDAIEDQHVKVELCDWAMIVSTATGVRVDTR